MENGHKVTNKTKKKKKSYAETVLYSVASTKHQALHQMIGGASPYPPTCPPTHWYPLVPVGTSGWVGSTGEARSHEEACRQLANQSASSEQNTGVFLPYI